MQQASSLDGSLAGSAATGPRAHGHAVQFYEDDAVLCRKVAEFVAQGILAGRSAVIIATAAHRRPILRALAAAGVEVARPRVDGQLTVLDARATLDSFLVDGWPDAARFQAVMGEILERGIAASRAGAVCAFGEMVDLLWAESNRAGALELERLWNELGAVYPFHLLCGYALSRFSSAADEQPFQAVCGMHDWVLPTERILAMREEDRLREITRLQQRAQALETEVDYRKVLERQLRAALAKAESASRAKSEFLAVMNHELRTPLNAIAGYADLMEMELRGPVTPQQREDLGRIQQAQAHLLGLIDEVLDYAEFEAGTIPFDLMEVPVAVALAAATGRVISRAQARKITLHVSDPGPTLVVRADADRLRQILTNLLANAVKFTEPGGRVSAECDVVGGEVVIRVHDTGIGIAPGQQEAIFHPFVQVSAELTRSHSGTGLGLAISRDVARGMGGDIVVESAPGEGSTFILRLPLAAGAAA